MSKHRVGRRRDVLDDLDRRHLARGRQQIIHEALRHQLALAVIGEFLIQRRADAVRDAAHGHAAHDLRIDHGAAIVPDPVAQDFRRAEIGIDGEQDQMKLEREAGIHLHAPVRRRQRAAGRHLHHVAHCQAGLEPVRHAVIIAEGDLHQVAP